MYGIQLFTNITPAKCFYQIMRRGCKNTDVTSSGLECHTHLSTHWSIHQPYPSLGVVDAESTFPKNSQITEGIDDLQQIGSVL